MRGSNLCFGIFALTGLYEAIVAPCLCVCAHKVRCVYILDPCLMGTETRDRRSSSGQLILCFGFKDGDGSGGARTRHNPRAGQSSSGPRMKVFTDYTHTTHTHTHSLSDGRDEPQREVFSAASLSFIHRALSSKNRVNKVL